MLRHNSYRYMEYEHIVPLYSYLIGSIYACIPVICEQDNSVIWNGLLSHIVFLILQIKTVISWWYICKWLEHIHSLTVCVCFNNDSCAYKQAIWDNRCISIHSLKKDTSLSIHELSWCGFRKYLYKQ